MTSPEARNRRWMTTGAIVVAAAAGGYGIAKLTTHPAPASTPPAAAAKGPQTIDVAADHIAAAGIGVETVSAGSLSTEIRAPATVMPAPNGEAVVTAHAAGTVVRLTKRLGDPVRAGEVLALVESRDAAAAAADRSVAGAKVALARKVAAREQRLYDQKVSPRQDLETAQAELAAAEAEARRASGAAAAVHIAGDGRSAAVVSPLSGRITAQTATLGAYVQPEAELFRVADPRFVQIEASVPGADASRIAPGDPAVLAGADGATLNAVVRSVTPTLNGQSRAATVVLTPAGGPMALTPGASLTVRITPKTTGPTAIVIPDEAVQNVGGRDVVFLRTAKGFTVQPVIVVARSAGRAALVSGLRAGQAIATRNAFLLKAELGKGAGDGE